MNETRPRWLVERREAARQALKTLALPDRAQHRFRFTDPAWLWPKEGIADAQVHVEIQAPQGAVAGTLPGVLAMVPEVASEYLGRVAGPEDPFLALNLASFASGAIVVIPRGARVDEAVRLRVRPNRSGTAWAVRNLFVVESGAHATVYEDIAGDGGLGSVVTEVVLAEGASLALSRMEAAQPRAAVFARLQAFVGRDSSLVHAHVVTGQGRVKSETMLVLGGRGARDETLALVAVDQDGHADFRAEDDHALPDTRSRVTVRAVASGHGHAVFTGLLRVREGARASDAYEEAKGLLLSSTAQVDVLPEIEVLNHDVRASHGAAVGPLDPEAQYYLMSRGLSATDAQAMLVRGFVEPVLSRLPVDFAARLPWRPWSEAER